MSRLTADQIIERIANANGAEPTVMRQQIEQALQNILADPCQPHSFMLADLFPHVKPTVDELVIALEYDLYDAMMPTFPGWEWDGAGYRNMKLFKRNDRPEHQYRKTGKSF